MKNSLESSRQTRRVFLQRGTRALAGMSLASAASHSVVAETSPAGKRPNFVFFLGEGVRADELSSSITAGWDAKGLSVMCNNIVSTPNLDRIVREGATFQNTFVTNAICLPSRATILTGLYSHKNGCIDNRNRKIPDNIPTIADILRENGYDVAFFGKAHVHDLSKRNWNFYFGIEAAGADPYHPVITESRNGTVSPPKKYQGYVDDLWTDRAIDWLSQERDKPFCLFLWFVAPHEPFYRARRYADLYNGIKIPKPATFDDDLKGYPGKPAFAKTTASKLVTTVDCSCPRSLEEVVKDHCAGVVSNDDNVGKVMSALEKAGILDETAIVLSSDHGFFLGEWGLYNKMFMHEPSIRVPLAVRYPRRVKPGTVCEQMALNLDIAPTMLELAGLEAPKWMQGHSLIPFMKGSEVPNWRRDWLYEYYDDRYARKNRGIRTEEYKLIHYWEEPEKFELYHLKTDPGELHNLYGNPQYAHVTTQLLGRLRDLRVESGDVLEA